MIRGEHVREEINAALDAVNTANDVVKDGTTTQRVIVKLLSVIVKVSTVIAKVVLSVRTNQKLIMNKLGVELVKPKVQEEEKPETTKE